MIRLTSILLIVFMTIFAFQCKIIDFSDQDIFVTITIEKPYNISSNSTSFSDSTFLNLAAAYADAEVEPEKVTGVKLSSLEVEITENSTGSNTTASGNISFMETGGTQYSLATFSNVNLNSVLNNPITPFSVSSQLTMEPGGVSQFTNIVQQIPPPAIMFYITGTVNQPPVNFKAKLVVKIQVRLIK